MWDKSKISVKEVLKQRFAKIAAKDQQVGDNIDEIRRRLMDLINEADSQNII